MRPDALIYQGDAVKALSQDGRVGGYLVRFGSPDERDLDGEYFTPATWYGHADGDGAAAMVHHGIPLKSGLEGLADRILSHPLKTRRDDVGIWAETVLDMADEYERKIFDLARQGKLGWSSGSAPHMVKYNDDGAIVRWPIVEGSLTPIPANPRSRAITLKSLLEIEAPAEDRQPEEPAATAPRADLLTPIHAKLDKLLQAIGPEAGSAPATATEAADEATGEEAALLAELSELNQLLELVQ